MIRAALTFLLDRLSLVFSFCRLDILLLKDTELSLLSFLIDYFFASPDATADFAVFSSLRFLIKAVFASGLDTFHCLSVNWPFDFFDAPS